MELDERKLRILQAIINDYISTAEPIGSRTIAKKYQLGISSATIRNEMADLEDLGYLEQPHTSAGRIPSDKGYRLYVDHLMDVQKITDDEQRKIQSFIDTKIIEIEDIVRQTSRILSQLTNYTSLVLAPLLKQNKLKHIQLLPIDESGVLLIVVTNTGVVKNTILRTTQRVKENHLEALTQILNYRLRGMELRDINLKVMEDIKNEVVPFMDLINIIFGAIGQEQENDEQNQLYFDGVSNIFNFPEYNDIEKAKAFLGMIEEKSMLTKMLSRHFLGQNKLRISIGSENNNDRIQNCSLITATYSIDGKILGSIGVIGPTRMDYGKVIGIVNSMTLNLTEVLSKIYNNNI